MRFVDPEGFNRIFQDTPLEVILVNSRSGEAPSVAAGDRAGQPAGRRRRRARPRHLAAAAGRARSRWATPTRTRAARSSSCRRRSSSCWRRCAASSRCCRRPTRSATRARRKSARRRSGAAGWCELLAEIEKRINEENARPKKRYISPATREEVYALYYDQLRRKIEERGTRNFPEYQGKKLYGELTMNVTVDAEGRVVDTEVVRPSRSKVLDRRAVAIVRAAAPFGPFSAAMRRKADQLVITSRFRSRARTGLKRR